MVRDALQNIKEVYSDETFYIFLLGIFAGLSFFFGRIELALLGTLMTALIPLGIHLFLQVEADVSTKVSVQKTYGDGVLLGKTENNAEIHLELESLNHMFIIGMTRYGKTRLVLSLISELIQEYRPEEVKLAFSDAKAVSFNVFARSQHLYAPIAKSPEATEQLIQLILEEMHSRLNTFSEYHEEICTNIDEYEELTGEKLPRIIVIFDEVADSVEMNSIAEKNLTTLAKMGLAAGINLILITQRPTKMGISHEITSQCQTIMCTYMKNSVEYGAVAKIPQKVYTNMVPEKGLFMVFNPDLAPTFRKLNEEYEGWGFLRSNYMDNNAVKSVAVEDSTENLDLPSLESSIPAWQGSEEEKFFAMSELENKLGVLTIDSMVKYFGVSRRTAKTWLNKYENLS